MFFRQAIDQTPMSFRTPPPQAYTRDTIVEAFNWLQTQTESVREIAKTTDVMVSLYLRAKRNKENGKIEDEAPVSSRNFKSDLKNLAEGLKAFESNGNDGNVGEDRKEGQKYQQSQKDVHGAPPIENRPHFIPQMPIHFQSQNTQVNFHQVPVQSNEFGSHTINQSDQYQQPTQDAERLAPTGPLQGHPHRRQGNMPPGAYTNRPPRQHFQAIPPLTADLKQVELGEEYNASARPAQSSYWSSDSLDPRSRQLILQTMEHLNLSSEEEALRVLISLGSQKLFRTF